MIKFVWIPLLGKNISFSQGMFEDPRYVWRWFSFSKGGICQFPGGYAVLYLQIPQSFEATKWQIRSAHRLGNVAKRRNACLQWLARVQARIAPVWPHSKVYSESRILVGEPELGKAAGNYDVMCKKVLMIGTFWSYKKDYNIKIQYITSEVVSHTSPSRWKKSGPKCVSFRVCVPRFRSFGVDRNFAIGTWLQKPISTTIGSNPPAESEK